MGELTITNYINIIKLLNIKCILFDNIYSEYLDHKGLHLQSRGVGGLGEL